MDEKGYVKVSLWVNKKVKTIKIHRLVAKYFVPNPYNYKEVNHKDENKTNNHAENLEWCTRKYNVNYGERSKKKLDIQISIIIKAKEFYNMVKMEILLKSIQV